MRRTKTVAAAAAVAALAVAAPAQAAHTQDLVFGATLLDQPKGQPWAVNLNIDATLGTTDGGLAAPLRHVGCSSPPARRSTPTSSRRATPKTFADRSSARRRRCSARASQRSTRVRCSTTSMRSSSSSTARATPRSASSSSRPAPRTPGSRSTSSLPGTLNRVGGRYSYAFDLDIPEIVAVNGAPPVAINGFNVDVGGRVKKHGKKISYIDAPTKCPSGGWPFTGTFTFGDGALPTLASHLDCTLKTVSGESRCSLVARPAGGRATKPIRQEKSGFRLPRRRRAHT